MSNDRSLSLSACRALLLVLLPGAALADSIDRVGVASVVNGEPLARPPTGSERVLHIGNDMAANEVVTTKTNDRAHIVFLDGSTLTVGPNSVIAIDRFVYDPEKRTGALGLDAGRGVFRYVGGAISKNAEVQIKARGATMGIRGGIATFTVAPNGATSANFLFGGSLTITSGGVTRTTTQPGTQINTSPGGIPTPPTPIPPGVLRQLASSLQSTPGATAPGAPPPPVVSQAMVGSGLGQTNSGLAPAVARAAIPAARQAQLAAVVASGGATPSAGSQQAAGALQPGVPQQSAGPLQGTGPVQGSGPLQATELQGAPDSGQQGATPLQAGGPLQATGPLQSGGPLESAGPLQNAGPLAAASPLQETAPVGAPGALALTAAPAAGGTLPAAVPVQQVGFIPALVAGSPVAMQQLQALLGTPQGTSVETLSTIVGAISSPAAPAPAVPSASPPPGTPAVAPLSVPVPLAPSVYNPITSVSPN